MDLVQLGRQGYEQHHLRQGSKMNIKLTPVELDHYEKELIRLCNKLNAQEQEINRLKAQVDEYREKAWMYDQLSK